MQRRTTMMRSRRSVTRTKMNASVFLVLCFIIGSAVGYNVQREAPYNIGPNDPYTFGYTNLGQEPSQRLFWGNQGSNQVGGPGLWSTLTTKFPFLQTMFGRMELPTKYGVPNQYDLSNQYSVPSASNFGNSQFYQTPQFYQQQQPGQFGQRFTPSSRDVTLTDNAAQFYQTPQFYQQQQPGQFGQRFAPSSRDVALTDDAVIVTPPFVPAIQPAPAPAPAPAPVPLPVPVPAPVPSPSPNPLPGYHYNKPQYRLELPHK